MYLVLYLNNFDVYFKHQMTEIKSKTINQAMADSFDLLYIKV